VGDLCDRGSERRTGRSGCSRESGVEGTRLPAGGLLLCHSDRACQLSVELKAHVCLPGACFTSSLPGFCFTTSLPGFCFTTSLPGPGASTTPTTSLTRSACRAGRSSQPNPASVRTTTAWHLS